MFFVGAFGRQTAGAVGRVWFATRVPGKRSRRVGTTRAGCRRQVGHLHIENRDSVWSVSALLPATLQLLRHTTRAVAPVRYRAPFLDWTRAAWLYGPSEKLRPSFACAEIPSTGSARTPPLRGPSQMASCESATRAIRPWPQVRKSRPSARASPAAP